MACLFRADLKRQMGSDAEEVLQQAHWLNTDAIQAVFSALEDGGDQARVVGGAVRNTLLGHPVSDIDIATTAPPQTVFERAQEAGLKPVGTGIDHGTVTVVSDGFPYEVTTLREDVETFGRQAKVVFGRDWTKDAQRRDFTMNALYADRHGRLHDPLGGLADCLAGRVRFIGDPDTRIREDYLRILRFFRIFAAYGRGELDPDGLGACLRQRDGLRHLSAERIGHELRRLVRAPRAAIALKRLNECGLWEIATGGLGRVDDFEALRSLDDVCDATRDPELGLLVLAGFVREDIDRITDRLRLSNAETKRMKTAWAAVRDIRAMDTPDAKGLLYDHGRQGAMDGVLVHWALSRAQGNPDRETVFSDVLAALKDAEVPVFPLKGADLLAAGYRSGPHLGDLLRRLELTWRESGFTLNRSELMSSLIKGG